MALNYLDKIELIKSVYGHRILWDQKCEQYLNRESAKIAWNEVSKELGFPTEECRKKWRGLRDIFTKETKKVDAGKKSTWRYMKLLSFLSDQVKPHNQTDQDINPMEYSEIDAPDLDIEDTGDLKEMISKEETESNHSFSTTSPIGAKRIRKDNTDIDEDYHFLMSLLPSMRSLPQKRKNIVRIKILQVLCEENV